MMRFAHGESRGRAAEYWGGDANLELDRWVQLNGVPQRARNWYDAQDPAFRTYLDEFARGINEFAAKNPGAIGAEYARVLPVSGVDVVGHPLRAVHYGYMGSRARMNTEVTALLKNQRVDSGEQERSELAAGSNTWAIGPARSASGNAMLLINPHLSWGNTFYRYMQVHLVGPDYDQVGTPQVGFPVAVVGFNRHTGWGRTVNTIDTVDFYRLTVRNDQYVFDGALRSFERDTRTLKVKQPDGSLREERLDIRRSVHGPVVFDENGVTVAMRVAGLDRPKMLEQWFRMGGARSLQEFQSALRMMSVPMWHANYADADRHIMFVFDGQGAVGKSIALYMVPGMNHCQGGVGTDTFDKVAAIEEWMARGTAPAQIVASHATDGKVDRRRPLCPYPQVAEYKGSGSTDEASSFSCRNPR